MAGRTLTVDMKDDHHIPAWQTVIELAATGISEQWTLVGGLMVAAHSRRAGVLMRRPTDDVDILVNYAANRTSLLDSRAELNRVGFELSEFEEHAYRFVHPDGRKIDLMVADHLPSRMQPRLARRPAFPVPSGEQAIRRRDTYILNFASGRSAQIGVPDEFGALVVKGAAWLADRRDRDRHLDDAAVLLACVSDVTLFNFESSSKNDRKRIRALLGQLADPLHRAWLALDESDRERATFNLAVMQQVIEG